MIAYYSGLCIRDFLQRSLEGSETEIFEKEVQEQGNEKETENEIETDQLILFRLHFLYMNHTLISSGIPILLFPMQSHHRIRGSRVFPIDHYWGISGYGIFHSSHRLNPDGRILFSRRISLVLSCGMDLTMFPFDFQVLFIFLLHLSSCFFRSASWASRVVSIH